VTASAPQATQVHRRAGKRVGVFELKVDPLYDPLRNDPLFQDLLRRARLAQ